MWFQRALLIILCCNINGVSLVCWSLTAVGSCILHIIRKRFVFYVHRENFRITGCKALREKKPNIFWSFTICPWCVYSVVAPPPLSIVQKITQGTDCESISVDSLWQVPPALMTMAKAYQQSLHTNVKAWTFDLTIYRAWLWLIVIEVISPSPSLILLFCGILPNMKIHRQNWSS